jgi:hypothetical protein
MLPTGIDYDPEIDLDEYGLSEEDRKTLGGILLSKGSGAVKVALERHFGTTFEQLDQEIADKKRYEERLEKMTKDVARFTLHYPLFLSTPRNHETVLNFLGKRKLPLNYKTLCYVWNELAHIDGALDLDESVAPSNPYYVGQINPASGFDNEWTPRKRVDQMSAEEFSNAIARSAKFRARIDGE